MTDTNFAQTEGLPLSQEQIDAFRRDGVICVRQAYSEDWVGRIAAFLDDIVGHPSPIYGPRDPASTFHSDKDTWLTNDEVLDFVLHAPSAKIAQQAFGSNRVTFLYDQIFVKDELSPNPTPWHHDFTFWPVEGTQVASLWTSVDPVDAESSALEFVAGSHRWPQRFRAIGANGTDYSTGESLDELPDFEADRSKYDIVSWDLRPGDALLFDALTLHGARGNRSAHKKRRAITTRWCGDDVVYRSGRSRQFYHHGLRDGDAFSSWLYPQVLPRVIEEQLRVRLAGPVLPDPELLKKANDHLSKLDRVDVPLDPAVS
jgi:ectoine hydroxylase-related dioxygenase (phytanoyl-CoA dioxygenase family)